MYLLLRAKRGFRMGKSVYFYEIASLVRMYESAVFVNK